MKLQQLKQQYENEQLLAEGYNAGLTKTLTIIKSK